MNHPPCSRAPATGALHPLHPRPAPSFRVGHARGRLVPRHLQRVRERREEQFEKPRAAVHERLTKEINHWDHQANLFREQEKAGKPLATVNRARGEGCAEELVDRLERRGRELDLAEQISATPPVVIGGAVVIPIGVTSVNCDLKELLARSYAAS